MSKRNRTRQVKQIKTLFKITASEGQDNFNRRDEFNSTSQKQKAHWTLVGKVGQCN